MNKIDHAIKSAAKNRIEVLSRFGSDEEVMLLTSLATYMEENYPDLKVKRLCWDKWGAIWADMDGDRYPTDEEETRISRCFTAWAKEYGRDLCLRLKDRPGAKFIKAMHDSGYVTYPFSDDPEGM